MKIPLKTETLASESHLLLIARNSFVENRAGLVPDGCSILFVDFACITGIGLMNRHGELPRTSDIANDSVCVVKCAIVVFVAHYREKYLR